MDLVREIGTGPEYVYAYTFPTLMESPNLDGSIRIKIGMTRKKTAEQRVYNQIGTSSPEKGVLLLVAKAENASAVEDHIHTRLKSKSRHVADSPGQEWFWTSTEEIIDLAQEKEPQLNSEWDPVQAEKDYQDQVYQEFKQTWTERLAWIGFGTCCYWGYSLYGFFASL